MNVLFATDGSADARAAGELLAGFRWNSDDRLIVMSVAPRVGFLTGRLDDSEGRLEQLLQDEDVCAAVGYAREAASHLADSFPRVETWVHAGLPSREILNVADLIEADLIVLGGQGKSLLEKWLLGSVSGQVLDRAAHSVLIGRAGVGALDRVVLGYDGSREADVALEWVKRLPLPEVARIEVVSVAETLPLPAAGTSVMMPSEYPNFAASVQLQRMTLAEELAREAVRRLGEGGLETRSHVRIGDSAEEILRVASEVEADLIVVGAHAGKGGFFDRMGDTARRIAQRAPCGALIARSGPAVSWGGRAVWEGKHSRLGCPALPVQ